MRTSADLEALLGSARRLRRTPRTALELDSLPGQEALRIQARINRRAFECGCHAGRVTGAAALVACVGYLVAGPGSPFHWQLEHLLLGTPVVIGSALAGKAVKVAHARVQLVRELERLRARISAG